MDNPQTAQIAHFIAATAWKDIPGKIHDLSKCLIFDNLGVTVAGSRSGAGRIIQRFVQEGRGPLETIVLGTNIRAPASMAALANGVAAHADDYDDTQIASLPDRVTGLLMHPTTPALAAALATAMAAGATGREFLVAYEIGLEVACKLAEAINPEHYKRGFHTTGTVGALGAFAAAAKLLKLTEPEIIQGIGIVASLASGLRGNFGTMTKPLHAGRAAENGIVAAKLAKQGYTATSDILDSQWGFFCIMGGGFDRQYLSDHLGNPFQLESPGVAVKPYPCGSLAHPTMDALRDLIMEEDLRPEMIERIDVGVTRNICEPLRYQRPQTALEAKFSLEYGITIIVLEGKAGLRQYTDETVQSSRVQNFLPRVNCFVDTLMEERGSNKMYSVIRVFTRNGGSFLKEGVIARGYPERPFSQEDLLAKFQECIDGVLEIDGGDKVWELLMGLEHLPELTEMVRPLVL